MIDRIARHFRLLLVAFVLIAVGRVLWIAYHAPKLVRGATAEWWAMGGIVVLVLGYVMVRIWHERERG